MKPKSRWPPGQTTPPTTLVLEREKYELCPTFARLVGPHFNVTPDKWRFNKNVFMPGIGMFVLEGANAMGVVGVVYTVSVPLTDVPDEDSVRAIGDMLLAMAIMKEGV